MSVVILNNGWAFLDGSIKLQQKKTQLITILKSYIKMFNSSSLEERSDILSECRDVVTKLMDDNEVSMQNEYNDTRLVLEDPLIMMAIRKVCSSQEEDNITKLLLWKYETEQKN